MPLAEFKIGTIQRTTGATIVAARFYEGSYEGDVFVRTGRYGTATITLEPTATEDDILTACAERADAGTVLDLIPEQAALLDE